MRHLLIPLAGATLFALSPGCSTESDPGEHSAAPPESSEQGAAGSAAGEDDARPDAGPQRDDAAATNDAQAPPERDADQSNADAAPSAAALYQRAKELMKSGQREEGYEAARAAMQQFIAEGDSLAWIRLESITVGERRVDVHFNMGPKERDPKASGIVRPLSFRVWSTGQNPRLIRTLDYEQGRFDGEIMTAAIGEQDGSTHRNYGMLSTDASYTQIIERMIEIVREGR